MQAKFKQTFVRGSLFLTLIFCATTTQLPAQVEGLTLHKKNESSGMMGRGGQNSTSVTYYGPEAIRQQPAQGDWLIIRLDEQTMISVNDQKKTYSVLNFDEIQGQIDEAGRKMEESENKQAMEMMKRMMGDRADAEVTVEKLGPGPEIAGFPTHKYLVKAGLFDMTMWVTDQLQLPDAYYDAMRLRTPPNPMFDMGKLFEALKQIEGVSLKSETVISIMGQKMTSTEEVTKAERGPISAGLFEVPEGYKEVPFGN